MSWWWPFKRKPKTPSPELLAAREQLAQVRAKDGEVRRLADELRRIREQNNFAAMFGFQERRR